MEYSAVNRGPGESMDTARRQLLHASLAASLLSARSVQAAGTERGLVIEPEWLVVPAGDAQTVRSGMSVLVEGDRIAKVESGRIRGRYPRLPLPGQLLSPGLISTHTHTAGGSVTRGLFEGKRSYSRPLKIAEKLDADALDAITAYNLAELLRSGCTTIVEMALSLKQAQSFVRVARRWGVRAYPSGMVPGTGRLFSVWNGDDDALAASEPETLAEVAANAAFAAEQNGAEGGLILPQMGPHACDTHTPTTLAAVVSAARELGNGLHIHLSQGQAETDTVLRRFGKTSTQWLEEHGGLALPVLGAHMTALDFETDLPLLRDRRVTYSHCPCGGGATGFTQPWPELLAAGVNSTVAIDTHSNDMVENLKLAVIKGEARWSLLRSRSEVPLKRPTIEDALAGATSRAAAGLRRTDIGQIVPGALADLTAIDLVGPLVGSGVPSREPLNHLRYANGLQVSHVMINGRWVINDGALVVDDFGRIAAQAGEGHEAIYEQLEAERFFD